MEFVFLENKGQIIYFSCWIGINAKFLNKKTKKKLLLKNMIALYKSKVYSR